ncbi:MAG: histidine phosphatase family protein, partial [Nannocystaceae bacterium]
MPRDLVSLYLLRHGETERHNCLYGHLDLALSARGQAQAQAQAQALKHIALTKVAS